MIREMLNRLRPGSTGEPISKVTTTGQEVSREASDIRARNPRGPVEEDYLAQNYPVAMGVDRTRKDPLLAADEPGKPIPAYAADDPTVLNRLFGLKVTDL